jgi:hypothetical protein
MCSFTQALCLTEQPLQATSATASTAADGRHESQPSHVHRQGLFFYDITKIPDYCDAFSDQTSMPDALWLSEEVERVRDGLGPAQRAQERERGSSVAEIC